MYSFDEAHEAALKYFNGNTLAAKIWIDKYALRNEAGELIERDPNDTHKRLATEFARIEKKKFGDKAYGQEFIFNLFKDFKYIFPQGSPMYGIGNKSQYVTISNCYVIEPPEDSYAGILRADQHLVQISKRRGGVGIDLDNLRPAKSATRNSSRSSTGVLSWATRYSNSIREVGQDGRRGALMLTLSVHHPDILTFATMKNDDESVTGANISVKLTDEFLNALKNDEEYELRWPVKSPNPSIRMMVSARKVWNTVIDSAHLRAEPGLLFWDNIINESPADCYAKFGFNTVGTNPCSELPLCANDSCRLLALVLFAFVEHSFTKKAYFNFKKFYEYAQIAQRLMDDMIDLEIECISRILNKIVSDPEATELKQAEYDLWADIRKKCKAGRRTGLGILGLGDTLAALGMHYGSKEGIKMVDKIYNTLKFGAYKASIDLAQELGSFELYDSKLEENCQFIQRFADETVDLGEGLTIDGKDLLNKMKKHGRRNIALLTTAPTGSISNLALMEVNGVKRFGTTGGIEPLFDKSYTRRKKGNPGDKDFRIDFTDKSGDNWMHFEVNHAGVDAWKDLNGDKASPYDGAVADEINWIDRVKLQAAAQKHVDHAISSTINLPEDVSKDRVAEIYTAAWELGLKGITVYRKGSRSGVLIEKETGVPKHDAPERPKSLECDVHHVTVKGQEYFVLVGLYDENSPYEVFAGKNGMLDKSVHRGIITKVRKNFYKAVLDDGTELSPVTLGCNEHEEDVSRLISLSLRHGASIEFICEQLQKTGSDVNSFSKSISRALKKYIKNGTKTEEACPECSSQLVYSEGCQKCFVCGYSKCS